MLVHTVLFWVTEDMTDEDRARFEQGLDGLLTISSVKGGWFGPPADTADRDVVDGSYGYGLTVLFQDLAGHDVYQECPEHLEFIATFKHLWKRVRVYDFETV